MASLLDIGKNLKNRTNPIVRAMQDGLQQTQLAKISYDRQRSQGATRGQQIGQKYIMPKLQQSVNYINARPNIQKPLVSASRFLQSHDQSMLGQFGSGIAQGSNMGFGQAPLPAPTTGRGNAAYTAGSLLGAFNPKSITGKVTGSIVRATNPILAKAVSPVANKAITGRLVSGAANVAQGAAINPLYGRKPLEGAALDFVSGAAFGPSQFGARGMAKGFDFGRNKNMKWNTNDVNELDQITDFLRKRKLTPEDLVDADEAITKLARGYLPVSVMNKLSSDYGKNSAGYLRAMVKELDKSAKRLGAYEAFDELKRSDDFDIPNLFGGNVQMGIKGEPITSVNPTGGVLVDYTPKARMAAPLGKNMRTLAETMKKSPEDTVTIYRGVSKPGRSISPGDFVTTDINSARSYGSKILTKKVKLGDIIDDVEQPLGGDYLYRPGASRELKNTTYDYKDSDWYKNYSDFLGNNRNKFPTLQSWIGGMRASGKSKSQLTEIWNNVSAPQSTGAMAALQDSGLGMGFTGSYRPKPQSTVGGVDETLDLVRQAIDAGDESAAKALYQAIPGNKPSYKSLIDEVDGYRNQIDSQAQGVIKSDVSDNDAIIKKFQSFLKQQGETQDHKTGLLYREHIPERLFGQSSDEVAASLGMTESEFMAEISKGLNIKGALKKATEDPLMQVKQVKVKNSVRDMSIKGQPGLQVNKGEYGEVTGVSAQPGGVLAPKTLRRIQQNQQRSINKIVKQIERATESGVRQKFNNQLDTITSSMQKATNDHLAKSKALFDKNFGRDLKEADFRRMENEWIKSYTKETITPKIKSQKTTTRIKQNEQALERLTNEWQQKANPGTVKPYNRGDLNTQQPFGVMKNFATAKDKYAFSYARETAVRNIEETFGKDAPKIKAFVTDKITENETNAVKFRDSIASQLKSVVKKNRIGKSSKDDALVFRFAEGRITEAELARETKNVKGVIDTANEFRATYDRLLDGINASLAKYGYDPIPKRKDYMTHFQEVGNFFENFGAIFQDKTMRDNLGDKLPTGMSGINMDTKPGKEFFRNALPRTGDKFTESAIGAMERYLEPASRQIYHTDSVQRVRALQSMVEQHAGKSGKNLSNFNSWLSEYGNILAGKKSVVDRPIEKILGRGLLKVGNAVRRRTGANMVGGNLSSALTNFIPLSQSVATTSKPAVMKGLLSSISTDARKIDGVESSFLTRRFQDASIAKNWTEKASDAASWAFKAVDHFSSRMIVGSKYYEGLSKGMDATSAMRQADDYAARIMADRSFGASPVLFNSQVLGALTQFQLEVNNQLSFIMKDIPKNLGYSKAQVASSIGQVLLYSYLFNSAYEKVTGRRPAFDPLGVALQAKEDYSNEDMKKGQATKNLTQNLVNQIPFASVATGGRMPMSAALPDVGKLASGESTLGKEALKPLTYLAPPFGGGQIKKTVEGLRAYRQGASTTPSGRVRYPIEKTPMNAVRTAVFGQYSTPEARDYFRSGTAPMGEKQSGRILSGITSGLFGGNKVSAAENSTALNIPSDPEEAKIFYKQALQEINNAKGNRIKYTYDSSLTEDERKKKLDGEMEKNIRAVNTINQMRKQNPDLVFEVEAKTHSSSGGRTVDARASWVNDQLSKAKTKSEKESLINKLYEANVLTKSVVQELNKKFNLNINEYVSNGQIKSLGGKGKKIAIKKVTTTPFKLKSTKKISFRNKIPKAKITKTKGYRVLTYTDNTPTTKVSKPVVRWS